MTPPKARMLGREPSDLPEAGEFQAEGDFLFLAVPLSTYRKLEAAAFRRGQTLAHFLAQAFDGILAAESKE